MYIFNILHASNYTEKSIQYKLKICKFDQLVTQYM